MSPRDFIGINVALTVAWLGLAILLGRMYLQRSKAAPPSESEALPAAA